jgi:hypothetical protein
MRLLCAKFYLPNRPVDGFSTRQVQLWEEFGTFVDRDFKGSPSR